MPSGSEAGGFDSGGAPARPGAAGALRRPALLLHGARAAPIAVGLAAAALLALFVAWPIALVLARSAGHYADVFDPERSLTVVLNSLAVAAVSSVSTVALGSVLAYAVTRADIPGKRFVSWATRLPMVVPPFFASLSLILLFSDGALVARALGTGLSIYGFHGIVIAQVLAFLPQAFLVTAVAFQKTDSSLEEVAENLGASGLTILRRVTLATARPGLVGALLIVFTLSLSDLGNPLLIGGGFGVLATEVYTRAVGAGDPGGSAAMGAVLLAPCLVAFALNSCRIGGGAHPSRWGPGIAAGRRMTAAARWPLWAVAAGSAASIVGLYGGIALASFARLPGTDWGTSLRHYRLMTSAAGASPILDSVRIALVAASLGTVLAVGVGYAIARRAPGARLLDLGSALPAALPGTVLGLGYLFAFSGPPLALTGTLWILAASVVFGKLPSGVATAVDGITRVDPSLGEAAHSLGAGPVRTFTHVTLPSLARTGLATAMEFFIDAVVTVSALIMLAYPGVTPAAVAILTSAQHGDLGRACALGTILFGLVLGAIVVRRRVVGRAPA